MTRRFCNFHAREWRAPDHGFTRRPHCRGRVRAPFAPSMCRGRNLDLRGGMTCGCCAEPARIGVEVRWTGRTGSRLPSRTPTRDPPSRSCRRRVRPGRTAESAPLPAAGDHFCPTAAAQRRRDRPHCHVSAAWYQRAQRLPVAPRPAAGLHGPHGGRAGTPSGRSRSLPPRRERQRQGPARASCRPVMIHACSDRQSTTPAYCHARRRAQRRELAAAAGAAARRPPGPSPNQHGGQHRDLRSPGHRGTATAVTAIGAAHPTQLAEPCGGPREQVATVSSMGPRSPAARAAGTARRRPPR